MAVHTNIKKRRYELKMSQQELAEAMGYKSRSTIAKIEAGENDVSHSKLVRFARVLDTTIEQLVCGTTARNVILDTSDRESEMIGAGRHVVIILAGGKSTRNQQNIPNQFINVLGKPIIIYCMEAYQRHPAIGEIYVVCIKGWEGILKSYAQQYGITKLSEIIPAGDSGILSIQNAVEKIHGQYSDETTVILQESSRPMIREETISKLLYACEEAGSAIMCQPMEEYIQFCKEGDEVRYVDRNCIFAIQSPEAYSFGALKKLFRHAAEQGYAMTETCCAMLMYNLGFSLQFCEGSRNNIKIVRQEDIAVFRALLSNENQYV